MQLKVRWWVGVVLGVCVAGWLAVRGTAQETRPATADDKAAEAFYNSPQVAEAVEKAHQGDYEKLVRLIFQSRHLPKGSLTKETLQKFHQYVQNPKEDPFVQHLAIQALVQAKDPSSIEPLQKFIVAAQRKVQDASKLKPNQEKELHEATELGFCLQLAVPAVSEMGGEDEKTINFLASQLKHDVPLGRVGGTAHYAMARKGRLGLRVFLKELESADEKQVQYIGAAISGMRDPELIDDLYAICLNPKYPKSIRMSALVPIAQPTKKTPQAEQLVLDLAKDEKSDLQVYAISQLGKMGTDKARQVLQELYAEPEKLDEKKKITIESALLECDTGSRINEVVKLILSSDVAREKKIDLCNQIGSLNKKNIADQVEEIKPGLQVVDKDGEPINEARSVIWLAIYRATGEKCPLEMKYENDAQFETWAGRIIAELQTKLDMMQKYPMNQLRPMAIEEAKKFITKWEKKEKEGSN